MAPSISFSMTTSKSSFDRQLISLMMLRSAKCHTRVVMLLSASKPLSARRRFGHSFSNGRRFRWMPEIFRHYRMTGFLPTTRQAFASLPISAIAAAGRPVHFTTPILPRDGTFSTAIHAFSSRFLPDA